MLVVSQAEYFFKLVIFSSVYSTDCCSLSFRPVLRTVSVLAYLVFFTVFIISALVLLTISSINCFRKTLSFANVFLLFTYFHNFVLLLHSVYLFSFHHFCRLWCFVLVCFSSSSAYVFHLYLHLTCFCLTISRIRFATNAVFIPFSHLHHLCLYFG